MTPEAVAAHYDKNKAQFMTPETVSLQYLRLDLAAIAANVQVTGGGPAQVLRRNRRSQRNAGAAQGEPHPGSSRAATMPPRRRRPRTSWLGPSPARTSPRSRASIRTTSAPRRGRGPGWATREAYVKEFSDALFGLQKQGDIVGPVRTQFGYRVIRLDGIETPRPQFEEVRAELEPEYRREQAQNEFYEKSQQLADESFAA